MAEEKVDVFFIEPLADFARLGFGVDHARVVNLGPQRQAVFDVLAITNKTFK